MTDWKQVDWSKKTGALARQHGVSTSWVSRMRGIHAPESYRRRSFAHIDLTDVDWNLSTKEIAEKYGAPYGFIAKARVKFGKTHMGPRKKIPGLSKWGTQSQLGVLLHRSIKGHPDPLGDRDLDADQLRILADACATLRRACLSAAKS